MRYIIKGGVWKNSEDEILKAAVMKYGLNQWSRISSLLVRKSAKQCKQRWYEWLDPSIKKTEWTREEQEKLLHLAKIFPSQWRTIAPMVGRTPMQCVEQYEKLLDAAQGKDLNDPNDPRRLRPGEIDPNPETKPARPDPIDMDEDEKEMLAEARVRLANTKGKKAKRKARGKLIEEARRLALLQKKRELKAAGIQYINHRIEKHHIKLQDRKYKGINYNKELAFERMIPEFAHKTTADEDPEPDKRLSNVSLQTMEGQRRDEEEEIRRKIDQRRIKKLKERELDQAVIFQNKQGVKFVNQTKLTLPEPQLKDQDLELLGKLNAVNEVSEYSSEATKALVGNYSTREQSQSIMRTPRVPNTVLREASNIIALQHTETPLVGGVNIPIQHTDPSTNLGNQTPNQFVNQLRTPNVLGQTPYNKGQQSLRGKQQPGFLSDNSVQQTPIHDVFKINAEEFERSWDDQVSQVVNPNHEMLLQMRNLEKLRQKLQAGLENLPLPKNEFSIEIPELEKEEAKQVEIEPDGEDKVKQNRLKRKEDQLKKFRQRSQAFQKNLPTPKELPKNAIYNANTGQADRDQIESDLSYLTVKLIKEDIENNQEGVGDIREAKKLLQNEINNLKQIYNYPQDQIDQVWEQTRKSLVYDYENETYVDLRKLDQEESFRVFLSQYKVKKELYNKLEEKQKKLQQKNTKFLQGYEKKTQILDAEIQESNSKIYKISLDHDVYKQAMAHERLIYRDRLTELNKYHDMLKVKQNELQSKYDQLLRRQQELDTQD